MLNQSIYRTYLHGRTGMVFRTTIFINYNCHSKHSLKNF
ncbi:hypothetical protein UNSWDHB_471 [Dehalobacter sp. UNSWDHB]|nr:hypothetical protein UNSWDHB_471 [Dehalobacter sp. UNSWDHB]